MPEVSPPNILLISQNIQKCSKMQEAHDAKFSSYYLGRKLPCKVPILLLCSLALLQCTGYAFNIPKPLTDYGEQPMSPQLCPRLTSASLY